MLDSFLFLLKLFHLLLVRTNRRIAWPRARGGACSQAAERAGEVVRPFRQNKVRYNFQFAALRAQKPEIDRLSNLLPL